MDTTVAAVVDQALRLWRLRQREETLIWQYTAHLTPKQVEKQDAWSAFHRATAQPILDHADDRYEA